MGNDLWFKVLVITAGSVPVILSAITIFVH